MPNPNHQILEFPITPNYSPIVTIDILGLRDSKSVAAIVDTGFNGFLQIPLSLGIASNLRLWGIRPSVLADGRMVNNLECFGIIRFGGREIPGIISLSDTGDQCLLGMQFLNELKADFTVSPTANKAIFIWKIEPEATRPIEETPETIIQETEPENQLQSTPEDVIKEQANSSPKKTGRPTKNITKV